MPFTDIGLQKCPMWVDIRDPDDELTLAIYLTAPFGGNSTDCYYLHNTEMICFQGRRRKRL